MTSDQPLKRNKSFNLVGEIDVFVVAISGVILPQSCFAQITQPHQYNKRTTFHKFVDVLTFDVMSSALPEQSK